MPIGSIINALAVITGSLIGWRLRGKFPDNIKAILFQGVGLSTLVLGMQMAFEAFTVADPKYFLMVIFSLILGGIVGELIHLDTRLEQWGDALKAHVKSDDAGFTEGLVTAFLIFCIGSMTFVGAINEGLTGDRSLILAKATLDGFTSIALASVYGIGVIFSVLPLFIVQAGLTLLAAQFQNFFSPLIISQMTAVGGALILGIGLSLMEIKKIKTLNLLPGLVIVVLLTLMLG